MTLPVHSHYPLLPLIPDLTGWDSDRRGKRTKYVENYYGKTWWQTSPDVYQGLIPGTPAFRLVPPTISLDSAHRLAPLPTWELTIYTVNSALGEYEVSVVHYTWDSRVQGTVERILRVGVKCSKWADGVQEVAKWISTQLRGGKDVDWLEGYLKILLQGNPLLEEGIRVYPVQVPTMSVWVGWEARSPKSRSPKYVKASPNFTLASTEEWVSKWERRWKASTLPGGGSVPSDPLWVLMLGYVQEPPRTLEALEQLYARYMAHEDAGIPTPLPEDWRSRAVTQDYLRLWSQLPRDPQDVASTQPALPSTSATEDAGGSKPYRMFLPTLAALKEALYLPQGRTTEICQELKKAALELHVPGRCSTYRLVFRRLSSGQDVQLTLQICSEAGQDLAVATKDLGSGPLQTLIRPKKLLQRAADALHIPLDGAPPKATKQRQRKPSTVATWTAPSPPTVPQTQAELPETASAPIPQPQTQPVPKPAKKDRDQVGYAVYVKEDPELNIRSSSKGLRSQAFPGGLFTASATEGIKATLKGLEFEIRYTETASGPLVEVHFKSVE